MPIDYSTLSPENLLFLKSRSFLPDLGTFSTTEDGLLKYAINPALENAERPNWFQRLVRAGNLLYDAMNYGGERAAAGDAARAAGMLRLFGDSPIVKRQSDLSKGLLESAIINGNQGINKSLGQISGTVPISTEQTIGDTLGLALSAFGLRDAGKAAGQAIGSLPSWYKAGRAANAIENASPAIRQLREADTLYKAASDLSPTATGDIFGDITNLSRVSPEAARVARPTVAKIMRYGRKIVENDPSDLIVEQTRRQAEIAETARSLQRQGLLDEETGKTLTKMFNEVEERYAPEIARRQEILASSGPAFRGHQTSAVKDFNNQYAFGVDDARKYAASMGNDALNNPVLANAPWNVGASTSADVIRNFAKLGEQEQMYRTIARDALEKAGVSLDNAAQASRKITPAILAGDALSASLSENYNPSAEEELAKRGSQGGIDYISPALTPVEKAAGLESILDYSVLTSDGSTKTFEEQSYEKTQEFLNASKEAQQKWYDQMNKTRDNYNKQIQELRAKIASTETQESERNKYIDQLIETENKFVDEYWNNPINWILALPMAALDMRRFRNPVSMWNRRAMDYAQSQPEVRALMLKLGYTKDLPSQRDVLKDDLGYIDSMSKADLSWLDQQRKDEQALLNAIIQAQEQRFINRERESQRKKNEAYAEYLKNKPTVSPQEALWNLYGGNIISSFTNPSVGASPFVEGN
jgi:hypothetical protein